MADGANRNENDGRPLDAGLGAAAGVLRSTGLVQKIGEVYRALSEAVGLDRVTLLEADAVAGEVAVAARWPRPAVSATLFDTGCALPIERRSLADLLHGGPLACPDLAVDQGGEATELLRADGFRSALYVPIPDHLDGPVIFEVASRTPSRYDADTAERFRRALAPPPPGDPSGSPTGVPSVSGPAERDASPDQALVGLQDLPEGTLVERMVQSEKMASVGKLASGVAHELNNPLTAVMGFAQLLLARDLDERTLQDVRIIMDEAQRASNIVENLLTFARRRPSEKLPVRINRLIERVIELRAYDIGLAGIEVELDLDRNVPPVLADPDQMQRVLLNMIINAEQAIGDSGEPGGKIWVKTWAAGDRVLVTLADSGRGVAQKDMLRVFDPFFTTKPVGEGIGLGLSICYGIVAEHGGHVSVENGAEGGARFTIDLPAAR